MAVHITLSPEATGEPNGTFGSNAFFANFIGNVAPSEINNIDGAAGSSTVSTPNENIPLEVLAPQGTPPGTSSAGPYGTVKGRFDKFNVINNPA